MDFSLTSDQILIRDTVRQFMETEIRPILREYEREEKFPAEQLRKLGELGCCGMLVPEEWGGSGTDTVSYALMLEEVARVDASTAVALSVTNSVVAIPIWKVGSEAQKKKYLTRLSRGEILGAFCLTEPQAGSDAAGIQTRATREGDHYILNGTKAWVTNGGVSGVYIVFAKTDPHAGSRGVTAFLVEPDFPGFRISRYEDKMGLRLSRSAEISLQDCRVPAENRLGEEGQGLQHRARIARWRPRRHRRAISRPGARSARSRRPLRQAAQNFRQAHRRLPGHPMDARRHANRNRSRPRMLTCSSTPQWIARAVARARRRIASRAKLYASEMANRVAYKAVQIHGSSGYSRETDVERYYRDARVLTIYEGTSEMQSTVIARDLLRA